MTDFGSNSKRESSSNGGEDTNPTTTTAATATASWTRLKDPRIVRVSRAFGGKDRHSKVCTVRGLRDRRVRLSVPTAIQLYDLQERLGLNQPSKVVDWLLHAARHEIDELPPLQIPPGIMLGSHSDHAGKFKDAAGERTDHHHHHHQSWMRDDDEEERHEQLDLENPNLLHRQQNQNHVSFSSLMSSSSLFGRWDPSSLTLSSHTNPIPISLGLTAHAHHQHHDLQQMVYQSAGMMMTQPYLMAPTNTAFDAARTFSFNMAADRHPNNGGNQQSKRDDLHPT